MRLTRGMSHLRTGQSFGPAPSSSTIQGFLLVLNRKLWGQFAGRLGAAATGGGRTTGIIFGEDV